MRFEQPSYARKVQELEEPRGGGGGACGGGHDMEDGPAFCVPADGVHCAGCKWDGARRVCFRNDCDALFTPPELRAAQREWEAAQGGAGQRVPQQVVVCAGPERSGSTWLYNAVRLLFQLARQPLDAYWLKDLTDAALDARGAGKPGAHHLLIKAHAWSEEWDVSRATHVFVTHRDLRQVLASFRRMTWEYELPESYVADHWRWKEAAELDIGFEDIIARPEAILGDLAARLDLQGVDTAAVLKEVSSLPVPQDWVDPVTQIWPNHISPQMLEARRRAAELASSSNGDGAGQEHNNGGNGSSTVPEKQQSLDAAMGEGVAPVTPSARAALDAAAAEALLTRFPDFFGTYGYA